MNVEQWSSFTYLLIIIFLGGCFVEGGLVMLSIVQKKTIQYIAMADTLYYSRPNDPNFLQTQVLAAFLNLTLSPQEINKKHDPLILLTPFGTLAQPNTILLYLARDSLVGSSLPDQLKVHEWFELFNVELHPLLREISEQISKERPASKEKYDYAFKELLRTLDNLNSHLRIRTFMVGDSITVLDISLATHLELVFKSVLGEDIRKKLPNLTRWFNFIRSTGPFLQVLGPTQLCAQPYEVPA